MLQVSKAGKRQYKSLGISINPDFWDFIKSKPKANCPNGDFIQKIILDKLADLQRNILELNAYQKEFSPTKLLEDKKLTVNEKTVGEFYSELLFGFKQADKTGNRLVYKMSLNSIKTFSKGKVNFMFADIDLHWLNRYEKWLRAKGNMETSMSVLFRTLRSAYNKAIDAKCAPKSSYPFDEYKISKFDVKTKKRAITKVDMSNVMQVDLSSEVESVSFARDIFIFSYLCGGINFTDIANLKVENIIDGRLQYIRQKTGKEISLRLSDNALGILSKYRQSSSSTGFLFPILDRLVHKSAIQKQNRIHKCLVRINKDLKRIGEITEIKLNLSTYTARHTFATVLKNSGVNVALISEALGHSDLATTQIYLDSFDNKQVDDAMMNLI